MEFKRISEDTVHCIISVEDMDELSIQMDDLFANSDKQRSFLETIVERAREEVDYNPPGDMIPIQVVPLANKGLLVTLIEKEGDGDSFKDILSKTIDSVKAITTEKVEVTEGDKEDSKPAEIERKPSNKIKMNIFRFPSLDDIEQYCNYLQPERKIKSRLFKDDRGTYFLILEKGRLSAEYFSKICIQAEEFGEFCTVSRMQLSYLEEHAACFIKKYAVNVLASYI